MSCRTSTARLSIQISKPYHAHCQQVMTAAEATSRGYAGERSLSSLRLLTPLWTNATQYQ